MNCLRCNLRNEKVFMFILAHQVSKKRAHTHTEFNTDTGHHPPMACPKLLKESFLQAVHHLRTAYQHASVACLHLLKESFLWVVLALENCLPVGYRRCSMSHSCAVPPHYRQEMDGFKKMSKHCTHQFHTSSASVCCNLPSSRAS